MPVYTYSIYIYIYIFYLLTLKFITIFKVPFALFVPRGLGCLCSAPQPPSHTETYAAVQLKGQPGNQSHQNLNAVPTPGPSTVQPNSSQLHTVAPLPSKLRHLQECEVKILQRCTSDEGGGHGETFSSHCPTTSGSTGITFLRC